MLTEIEKQEDGIWFMSQKLAIEFSNKVNSAKRKINKQNQNDENIPNVINLNCRVQSTVAVLSRPLMQHEYSMLN